MPYNFAADSFNTKETL